MPRPAPPPPLLPFVLHCLELLGSLDAVRARRMFGGFGLYAGEVMVALVAHERLYLKTDGETRPAFAQAVGGPFVHAGAGRSATMSYWTVPAEAMDNPALMAPWAQLALQAALRARLRPAAKAPPGAPAAPAAAATRAAPARARRR